MSAEPSSASVSLTAAQLRHLEEVCDRFEAAWQRAGPADPGPQIKAYLGNTDEREQRALVPELLALDLSYRRDRGESPRPEDYQSLFPEHHEIVLHCFQQAAHSPPLGATVDSVSHVNNTHPAPPPPPGSALPARLGRYPVTRQLGAGSFGAVYLAYDDQLERPVAIKLAHPSRITNPEDALAYLAEARIVAGLDHPHIVPVHDIGRTEDGLPFIVSKFIEGTNLSDRIKDGRPGVLEGAALVATIAEALHYAHRKGLVHRDIKPGNILLDTAGRPYLADFGLALKEVNLGQGPRYMGTPLYMSPEQAAGEGHRVNGRSDVFSLGVVFYELLTGRRPFRADNMEDLLEHIQRAEPRPPRQIEDGIPRELERICLKALSKRASERYTTAKDLADELREFLNLRTQHEAPVAPATHTPVVAAAPMVPSSPEPSLTAGTGSSDLRPVIVPKGLRCFDADDADYFLELLPGPRDRDGLPDSIRFWKNRIEQTDPDQTFAVGLLYGPSGCGKSSLVRAGLLPRLKKHVVAVYLEATAEDTEARLLKGLRKACPDLSEKLDLVGSIAAARRGHGIARDRKLLIVLDQFEQWLHAGRNEQNTHLVQALRQCDGGRVQCLVLIRDDFWLAVSRFFRELEVQLLEGHNTALVDLFDSLHARKVLRDFGRAFGRLPEKSAEMDKEQIQFVDQAMAGLAEDGKVVPVRLALFAEMVKGRPWTPATLKAVGGMAGVGVTFLEETFGSATAPPQHRLHQRAAQAVLKVLLPEAGTDIKGHMRSQEHLLEASGYRNRPGEFDDLLRILDSETRLITPTDPEGLRNAEHANEPATSDQKSAKFYQLTHDYLVPSLRAWLTRKQKETRQGRAELLLADRAAIWNARPENRQMPSLLQWFQIQALTARKNWTPPQRRMMARASRLHALRAMIAGLFIALLGLGAYESHGIVQAHFLRDQLLNAPIDKVQAIVDKMAPHRKWVDPLLHQALAQAMQDHDRARQLNTSLALVQVDGDQVDYLRNRLLDAEPNEIVVIRHFLEPHKAQLVDQLWAVVQAPEKGKESQRLRAAAALATYDPDGDKWSTAQKAISDDLVNVPAVHLSYWMEALHPIRARLFDSLAEVFRNTRRRDAERSLATEILANYAADQPQLLATLVMDADARQFAIIFPRLQKWGLAGVPAFMAELEKLPARVPSSDPRRAILARRQATAAVALLRMGKPDLAWPLLSNSPDPSVRSYLIHRLGLPGANPQPILKRLSEKNSDTSTRMALLLSLGQFDIEQLAKSERQATMDMLLHVYRDDPDPGMHGAARWLLGKWNRMNEAEKVDQELATQEQRSKRLAQIRGALSDRKAPNQRYWYVNNQGQTMVVLPTRQTFAISSTPVTRRQFTRFLNDSKDRHGRYFSQPAIQETLETYAKGDECPAILVTWYMAAEYCNWLSKLEGLECCYEPKKGGGYEEGMAFVPGRNGYRLPTDEEWAYACRAGTKTRRYYGEADELLDQYAWYRTNSQNRTWPVASLKPNDWGMFDMYGSVRNWCQDTWTEGQVKPVKGVDRVDLKTSRLQRGTDYDSYSSEVDSNFQYGDGPASIPPNVGFRVARTY